MTEIGKTSEGTANKPADLDRTPDSQDQSKGIGNSEPGTTSPPDISPAAQQALTSDEPLGVEEESSQTNREKVFADINELKENPGVLKKDSPYTQQTGEQPTQFLQRCLQESFDLGELADFCWHKLPGIRSKLSGQESIEEIVRKMLMYCERQGELDKLWDYLVEANPKKYKIYYDKYGAQFDSINRLHHLNKNLSARGSNRPVTEEDQALAEQLKNHPLTTDDKRTIKNWFFNDLDQKEKSFLITVALFEGISRKQILGLTNDIEYLLFGDAETKS